MRKQPLVEVYERRCTKRLYRISLPLVASYCEGNVELGYDELKELCAKAIKDLEPIDESTFRSSIEVKDLPNGSFKLKRTKLWWYRFIRLVLKPSARWVNKYLESLAIGVVVGLLIGLFI